MRAHLHLGYCGLRAARGAGDGRGARHPKHVTEEVLPGELKHAEDSDPRRNAMISNFYLLKGQIYENRDRHAAAECNNMEVRTDITCVEAMTALTSHQMLSLDEERDLVSGLAQSQQPPTELSDLVSHLYWGSLKKYSEVKVAGLLPGPASDKWAACLKDNSDVRVSELERLYYNCDHHAAINLSTDILKQDPHHPACLPIHVALLVELNKTSDLFKLSHSLVDLFPEWCVAWYAVGCYYYSTGRQDPARRYLEKATKQDIMFGPAWLAYGHSFAVENEHDQAMAAYFKASQLMAGCHLPQLYIGLEYSLTNNTQHAEMFFSQALEIAPNDPFVLHELGVTAFSSGHYERAEKYLSDALLRVESVAR